MNPIAIGVPAEYRVSKNRTRELSGKIEVANHGVPEVFVWITSKEMDAPPPFAAAEIETVSGKTKGVVDVDAGSVNKFPPELSESTRSSHGKDINYLPPRGDVRKSREITGTTASATASAPT
jgi:hypothetical protein